MDKKLMSTCLFFVVVFGVIFPTFATRFPEVKGPKIESSSDNFVWQNDTVTKKKREIIDQITSHQSFQKSSRHQSPRRTREPHLVTAPPLQEFIEVEGDVNKNGKLDIGEKWEIETSKNGFLGIGKLRVIYRSEKGEIKIDVKWGKDKTITEEHLTNLIHGGIITVGDDWVVLQRFDRRSGLLISKGRTGTPVGVGPFMGSIAPGPIGDGFFGAASGKVNEMPSGAITVEAKLDFRGQFASWGYDFKDSVNAEGKTLFLYVYVPKETRIRVQARGLDWHNAKRFDRVQAWSDVITLSKGWQVVKIDLSQLHGDINLRQLKHIAIEFGLPSFNNEPGTKIKIGDSKNDLPGFVFIDQ